MSAILFLLNLGQNFLSYRFASPKLVCGFGCLDPIGFPLRGADAQTSNPLSAPEGVKRNFMRLPPDRRRLLHQPATRWSSRAARRRRAVRLRLPRLREPPQRGAPLLLRWALLRWALLQQELLQPEWWELLQLEPLRQALQQPVLQERVLLRGRRTCPFPRPD